MRATRATLLLLALTASSCGRPSDQRTGSLDPMEALRKRQEMPVEVQAQLDSGSASFRAQDLSEALRHYTAATDLDGGAAAGWFGVYMAQKALGHAEEAQAALERVRSLAPGATLVEPEGGSGS